MTLTKYEQKLKQVDSRFRIKRYGASKAGIHFGNLYVCAVPQGEISKYTVFAVESDHHDQYKSRMNPRGAYKWKRIIRRGRLDVAKILYTKRFITNSSVPKLS